MEVTNLALFFIQKIIVLFIKKENRVLVTMDLQDFIQTLVKRTIEHQLVIIKLIMKIVFFAGSIGLDGNVRCGYARLLAFSLGYFLSGIVNQFIGWINDFNL